MKLNCAICGKEFESANWKKYCSPECRKESNKKRMRKYLDGRIEQTKAVKELESKNICKKTPLTYKQKKDLNEKIMRSREWLAEYNESGAHGGDAMIAKEAGMSYTEWTSLPSTIRWDRKMEILNVHKYYAKKNIQRI